MPSTFIMGNYKRTPPDNVKKAYNFFISKGLQPHQASGLIGNFIVESGSDNLKSQAYNPDDRGKPSFGIAQWRGDRFDKLRQRKNFESIEAQLQYVWDELNSTERRALSKLKQASNVDEAALAVSKYYERPHKDYAHNDRRVKKAKNVFSKYDGKTKVATQPVVTKQEIDKVTNGHILPNNTVTDIDLRFQSGLDTSMQNDQIQSFLVELANLYKEPEEKEQTKASKEEEEALMKLEERKGIVDLLANTFQFTKRQTEF